MRTTIRRLLVSGGVITVALLILAAVPAAAQSDCTLTVDPKSGPPGTEFVMTGTGFTSTTMTLTRRGDEPRTLPLTDGGTDPFVVSLIGGDSDVGHWRAVAEGCSDPATFQVTLPPTAAGEGLATVAPDRTPVVAAFGLLGVLFLVVTGTLLPRFSGSRRAR